MCSYYEGRPTFITVIFIFIYYFLNNYNEIEISKKMQIIIIL